MQRNSSRGAVACGTLLIVGTGLYGWCALRRVSQQRPMARRLQQSEAFCSVFHPEAVPQIPQDGSNGDYFQYGSEPSTWGVDCLLPDGRQVAGLRWAESGSLIGIATYYTREGERTLHALYHGAVQTPERARAVTRHWLRQFPGFDGTDWTSDLVLHSALHDQWIVRWRSAQQAFKVQIDGKQGTLVRIDRVVGSGNGALRVTVP